jgi:hypothetical protein
MLWLGDSISEAFHGTAEGKYAKSLEASKLVWEQHYGKYNAAVFACYHDRTVQLIWRMLNGESPQARKTTLDRQI